MSATNKETIEITLEFVEKINNHDVDGICSMITDDHVFIDALGERYHGKSTMRDVWSAYFRWFPDYRISVEHVLYHGRTAGLYGYAAGTYAVNGQLSPENSWKIPVAWRSVIQDGRIVEWRLYADNKPVYDILDAQRGPKPKSD